MQLQCFIAFGIVREKVHRLKKNCISVTRFGANACVCISSGNGCSLCVFLPKTPADLENCFITWRNNVPAKISSAQVEPLETHYRESRRYKWVCDTRVTARTIKFYRRCWSNNKCWPSVCLPFFLDISGWRVISRHRKISCLFSGGRNPILVRVIVYIWIYVFISPPKVRPSVPLF